MKTYMLLRNVKPEEKLSLYAGMPLGSVSNITAYIAFDLEAEDSPIETLFLNAGTRAVHVQAPTFEELSQHFALPAAQEEKLRKMLAAYDFIVATIDRLPDYAECKEELPPMVRALLGIRHSPATASLYAAQFAQPASLEEYVKTKGDAEAYPTWVHSWRTIVTCALAG